MMHGYISFLVFYGGVGHKCGMLLNSVSPRQYIVDPPSAIKAVTLSGCFCIIWLEAEIVAHSSSLVGLDKEQPFFSNILPQSISGI